MSLRTVMYSGLALTAAAALVPLIDLATVDSVTDHVRAAYPDWSASDVSKDRTAIVSYLAVVGALGVLCWLWAIRSVGRGSARARAVTTALFAVGACWALYDLTWSSAEYAHVIPVLYGVLGLLPCLAGLAAVVLVWRGREDGWQSGWQRGGPSAP
ncbi:hypothetical protein [Streptomyces sp. NPDC048172]|uniref:hypothetical protein n=1 Tax=Streptomyces sp. NPDC048172 TaxID=3365505 RepID=UPI003718FBF2